MSQGVGALSCLPKPLASDLSSLIICGGLIIVPNAENVSYNNFSSTSFGSKLPMNKLAPTSNDPDPDFLSNELLLTRIGLLNNLDVDSPVPIEQTEKVDELEPFTEQEQVVLDVFKAQWFGRADGYKGTTYSDAALFCNNVAGMELCPIVAYCPNGPVAESVGKPLFLQLPAFEGEQWSPVIADYDGDDVYVLTGTINGNPTTTCHTYRHFHDGEIPQWGIDGSEPEKKLYTLCCKDPSYVSEGIKAPAVDLTLGGPDITDAQMEQEGFSVEDAIAEGLKPSWFGLDDGWLGGSHSDGEWFCSGFGKQLCPYAGKLLLPFCLQLSDKVYLLLTLLCFLSISILSSWARPTYQ